MVQQFDAKVPHAVPLQLRNLVKNALRLGMIERVAAASVRLQRMLDAHAVAQAHLVLHAGETARRRAALALAGFLIGRERCLVLVAVATGQTPDFVNKSGEAGFPVRRPPTSVSKMQCSVWNSGMY